MNGVSLLVNLLGLIIVLAIIVLAGRWFIGLLGLGDPWPTILILIVVLIALGFIGNTFWGRGPFIRVGGNVGGEAAIVLGIT